MSKASHKMSASLSTRETMSRITTLGKLCNRPLSQEEIKIVFSWIDAVLFDYYLVQALLTRKIGLSLPAEEITSFEQFVEVMKVDVASRAKLRIN